MKKGELVLALAQPINFFLNEEQLKSLGFVKKVFEKEVLVDWPGVGMIKFRKFDLESVDS